jgi:peptide/nickel transport system substrate-binding protein
MAVSRLARTAAALVAVAVIGVSALPARADDALLYGKTDGAAKRGGKLTVGSLVEPPALDPFHQAADARIAVSGLMYQGLMYEDPSGTPQPLLATGYTMSEDGKTYTFKIRDGVVFHDGKKMTAEDVKYSYDYLRDKNNGSPGAGDLASVESIEAPDQQTVVFKLSQPNAALPMTLTNKYGAVIPKDYFAGADSRAKMNEASVGTGPFRLKAFKPTSFLVLERNKNYWQKELPYLDEVTFVFIPNSASLLVSLRNKRVDLALLSRPQDADQIKDAPGLVVQRTPSLNQKALDLDRNYKPLDDVRVRQAIALAIDKEEVMKAAIGGYGTVIGTMVAGMQKAWGLPLDQLPFQKPDPERAKKLLGEAGHAGGVTVDLTTIIGYDWMDPAAVTIASQLQRVGINVNIQRMELGVWINNFRSRNMRFTFNDWATSPDPSLLFYRHFHKQPEGADFRNWNNAKASELLDVGQRTSDLSKRKETYDEFQKVLAEDVPTIMLFSPDLVTVMADTVKNYQQHPTGWYFGLIKTYRQ